VGSGDVDPFDHERQVMRCLKERLLDVEQMPHQNEIGADMIVRLTK